MTALSAIAHAASRLKKENARFISLKTTGFATFYT